MKFQFWLRIIHSVFRSNHCHPQRSCFRSVLCRCFFWVGFYDPYVPRSARFLYRRIFWRPVPHVSPNFCALADKNNPETSEMLKNSKNQFVPHIFLELIFSWNLQEKIRNFHEIIIFGNFQSFRKKLENSAFLLEKTEIFSFFLKFVEFLKIFLKKAAAVT